MKLTDCCIVSVGVGQWYPKGLDRLAASLIDIAPDVPRALWRDHYPDRSPTHQEDPYAFKLHAVSKAAQAHRYVLWLDACAWCVRHPLPLFEHVEQHGGFFMQDGWKLGQWCSDPALAILGLTRDAAMEIPLITGGFWAIDTHTERGKLFLRAMHAAAAAGVFRGPWSNTQGEASPDPRCLGHRHDMTALSLHVRNLEYPTLQGDQSFVRISHLDTGNPRTCFLAQGL